MRVAYAIHTNNTGENAVYYVSFLYYTILYRIFTSLVIVHIIQIISQTSIYVGYFFFKVRSIAKFKPPRKSDVALRRCVAQRL